MTFAQVVTNLLSIINLAVGVLSTLALVLFFWGLVKYIYHSSDTHAHEEGRETIMWSLIALFILFSIWGILELLNVTFSVSPSSSVFDTGAPPVQYLNNPFQAH